MSRRGNIDTRWLTKAFTHYAYSPRAPRPCHRVCERHDVDLEDTRGGYSWCSRGRHIVWRWAVVDSDTLKVIYRIADYDLRSVAKVLTTKRRRGHNRHDQGEP